MGRYKISSLAVFLSVILLISTFFVFVGTIADTKASVTLEYDQSKGTASILPQLRGDKYEVGQAVKIAVAPGSGFMISSWIDNFGKEIHLVSKDPVELDVILTANTNIKINFTKVVYYSLTLNKDGTGTGDVDISSADSTFLAGTEVTLTANPRNGSIFTGWSGDVTGTDNIVRITMDANKTVTAQFDIPQPVYYTLTTDTVGTGTGEIAVSPPGTSFLAGSAVTITAIPASNSIFEGWSGAASGTTTQIVVVMNQDKSVIANFGITQQQETYTLNISKTGRGRVVACPYLPSYPAGTEVTLYAEEDEYWQFLGWSGGVATGTAKEIKITMNANTSVTAAFIKQTVQLSVSKAGIGSGEIYVSGGTFNGGTSGTGSWTCDAGSIISIFAQPSSDSRFGGFTGATGGNVGLMNPIVIKMDSAKSLTSVFQLNNNQKPIAVNDQYSMTQNSILNVPIATGVLSNDKNSNGQALLVTATSDPLHGTVTLNKDGSFEYSPVADFTGTDYFAYTVSNGVQSDLATVTIIIN